MTNINMNAITAIINYTAAFNYADNGRNLDIQVAKMLLPTLDWAVSELWTVELDDMTPAQYFATKTLAFRLEIVGYTVADYLMQSGHNTALKTAANLGFDMAIEVMEWLGLSDETMQDYENAHAA